MPVTMKTYRCTARFPHAKEGAQIQHVTVQATGWPTAARRALQVLIRRPGVKKHKMTVVELRLEMV